MKKLKISTASFLGPFFGLLLLAFFSFRQLGNSLHDLRVYWIGARIFLSGANPYDADFVVQFSKPYVGTWPFNYAPLSLLYFSFLGFLTLAHAQVVWLILKFFAMTALLSQWKRLKLFSEINVLVVLGTILAFHHAVQVDFGAGNISTFEQLGLWVSIVALIEKRFWGFIIPLVLVAQFKWNVEMFLVLWPLTYGIRITKRGVIASVFVALITSLNFLFPAVFMQMFLATSKTMLRESSGSANPAAFPFWDSFAAAIHRAHPEFSADWGPRTYWTWAVLASLGALYVWTQFQKKRKTNTRESALELVMLVVSWYAIVIPRFKDYSYILLIPFAFYVLSKSSRWIQLAILLLVFVDIPVDFLTNASFLKSHLGEYQPYIASLFLAGVHWRNLLRRTA